MCIDVQISVFERYKLLHVDDSHIYLVFLL